MAGRFEVTIHMSAGPHETYTVLTWLDDNRAIVLASRRFRQQHPTETISSTGVRLLGPAPRAADGTVDAGRDVLDRMEF